MEITSPLREHFQALPDPRMEQKCDHCLLDIIMIAICATLANAESWEDIAEFGRSKLEWFRQWLSLPHGIPSHDTFRRVFELLDPVAFENCFMTWVRESFELSEGERIAVDGKTLRGGCDSSGRAHLQLVSAWASDSSLSLGQRQFIEQGNEISTIPTLLDWLVLKGCIVTIDAAGCQKNIAQQLRQAEADYILTVRGNQPTLHQFIQSRFQAAAAESARYTDHWITQQTAHGRWEQRECWVLADVQARALGWQDCRSLIRITRTRQETGKSTSQETRYYISSLPPDAAHLLESIRAHWEIENTCHWVLDVVFREDQARTRARHADHNLALARKFALNLLKRDPAKGSLKGKRYRASINEDYLAQLILPLFNLMR